MNPISFPIQSLIQYTNAPPSLPSQQAASQRLQNPTTPNSRLLRNSNQGTPLPTGIPRHHRRSFSASRKTVTALDVVHALESRGRTLYGFGALKSFLAVCTVCVCVCLKKKKKVALSREGWRSSPPALRRSSLVHNFHSPPLTPLAF
jgi:hypothetical protein